MPVKRESNIELLRIVAMFLIMFSHFSFHGYNELCGGYNTINNPLNEVFLRGCVTGNLGNALFMIITGFFLCKSKGFQLKKLVNVVLQVITYSVLCYCVYLFYSHSSIQIKDLFTALTPLIHSTYWYFSAYVLVYLLHPYINIIISNTDRKTLGLLILIMGVAWGIIPDFLNLKFGRSYFLVFCFYYLIGAFLRTYYERWEGVVIKWKNDKVFIWCKRQNVLILVFSVALWLSLPLTVLYIDSLSIQDIVFRFYRLGSPLTVILSISLFLLFYNTSTIKSSNAINVVAGCVGGVYLLHDNPYLQSILYRDVFHLERYVNASYLVIYTIGIVSITFVVCVLVEYIRKNIYKQIESRVFREQ